MSGLAEWLGEILLETFGTETPRGLLLLALVSGMALFCTTTWLLLTYPRPLLDPQWGVMAIMCEICFGAMGAMLSGLHFMRDAHDRKVAAAALMVNVAAIVSAAAAATAGS